jgi:hypothetical protein
LWLRQLAPPALVRLRHVASTRATDRAQWPLLGVPANFKHMSPFRPLCKPSCRQCWLALGSRAPVFQPLSSDQLQLFPEMCFCINVAIIYVEIPVGTAALVGVPAATSATGIILVKFIVVWVIVVRVHVAFEDGLIKRLASLAAYM